jgi:competence protein ComEC
VQVGQQSVLLTGDIEAKSERQILARTNQLASTILVVPHHGSRTSSSLEFIQAVHPQYAIIPVGYQNSYGHPKPDIVERYQNLGIKVLDTVHHGAIRFALKDSADVLPPILYRLENQRYWHNLF